MLDLGALYGRLTLDTSGWDSGISAAQSSLGTLTSAANVAAAAIGAALTGAAAYGVSVAAGMETTQIAFETLLGSAEAAGAYVQQLRDDAAATPFEFAGLSASAQRLIGMGLNAEQARLTTLALGDAVSAVGGGTPELQRAAAAFGQMAAKGKTSMEELQQLAENNIPAVRYLAEGMGVSVAEAMAKVSSGGVSAAEGMKAIMAGIVANSEGAMAKQSATLTGRLSTLKDDVSNALGEAFGPLRDALSRMLGPLTEFALSAVDAMQPLIDGATEAARYLGALMAAINTITPETRAFAIQVAVVGVGLLAAAGAMGTMSAGVGAAAAPIAQTASVLGSLGQAASGAVAVVTAGGPVLSTLWQGLSNVGTILTSLVPRVLAWIGAQLGVAPAAATAATSTAALAVAEGAEATAAVAAAAGTGTMAAAVAALEVVLGPAIVVVAAAAAGFLALAFVLAEVASAISIFSALYTNNIFGIGDATDAVVDGAMRAFGALGDFVGEVFTGIQTWTVGTLQSILDAVDHTIQRLAPMLEAAGLGNLTGAALESLRAGGAALVGAISDPGKAFSDMAEALANSAGSVWGSAAGVLSEGATAAKEALLSMLPADMRKAFEDFLSGVQGAAAALPSYAGALDGLTESAVGGKEGAATGGIPADVQAWFDTMTASITTSVDQMSGDLATAGGNLDEGLGVLRSAVNDYVRFWQGARDSAIGSLGDLGGMIQAGIEGGLAAGPAGAAAGVGLAALGSSEAFSNLVSSLNEMVATLVTALDPVIHGVAAVLGPALLMVGTLLDALAPIFDFVGNILMGLAPAIMVIGAAFQVVGVLFSTLEMLLAPIMPILDTAFRALFEVLKAIAEIILYVMLGIQTAWNAIVGAVAGILAKLSDVFGGALDGLVEKLEGMKADTTGTEQALGALTSMTYESAYEQANLAANAATTAATMEDVTEALTNVPSGYKVASARFDAIAADAAQAMDLALAAAAGATTASTGGSGGTRGGGSGPTTGGRRRSAGPASVTVNIGEAKLSAMTVTDLAVSGMAEADKRRKALTGMPMATAGRFVAGRRR